MNPKAVRVLERLGGPAIALGLLAALTWARTASVSENFWLFGEQTRDWGIALRHWTDLPLSGTPSTVGGTSLGPVYYWTLWIIRVTVGPFFDNLPHAGAIGLSMIQAAGDALLFFAVWRHSASASIALGVVLLCATASYDMALSAMVWNPPLSVAFVKIALALFLRWATHPSAWRMALIIVVAWFAVQAHSSAIFFFVPVAAWFVVREAATRQWKRGAQTARLIIEILLVLQLPFLYDRLSSPVQGRPTIAIEAVTRLATDPAAATPGKAYTAVREALSFFWAHPRTFAWMNVVLGLAAFGCVWAARGRPWIVFVTTGPLLLAVIAFSGWTRPFDHYWYLTLSPPAAFMVGEALRALPEWRMRETLAIAFLAVVLWLQPARLYAATFIHKLPEYRLLVRGSREIARRTPEIRDIFTDFELPPSTDRTFLYVCLGGRVSTDARYHAYIARDGSVTFREAR